MSEVTTTLTEAGAGDGYSVSPGKSVSYAVAGTFTGTASLEKSPHMMAWEAVQKGEPDKGFEGTYENTTSGQIWLRIALADPVPDPEADPEAEAPKVTGQADGVIKDITPKYDELRKKLDELEASGETPPPTEIPPPEA